MFGAAALAGEPFDHVRDGRRHDWLAFADALSVARAAKWLQDHADATRIVYKINTMAARRSGGGGAGLVLLPCYIGAAVQGLAQLTPPLRDLQSELWVITHPDLRNTARVRAFLDFCADEIARRRPIGSRGRPRLGYIASPQRGRAEAVILSGMSWTASRQNMQVAREPQPQITMPRGNRGREGC